MQPDHCAVHLCECTYKKLWQCGIQHVEIMVSIESVIRGYHMYEDTWELYR